MKWNHSEQNLSFHLVKTMTYTYETCNDREFQVALPTEEPFLRYGCLHLSYKASSLAWRGNLKCELYVQANRLTLEKITITGDKALNVWNTKAISVNKYWRRFNSPVVRFLNLSVSILWVFLVKWKVEMLSILILSEYSFRDSNFKCKFWEIKSISVLKSPLFFKAIDGIRQEDFATNICFFKGDDRQL